MKHCCRYILLCVCLLTPLFIFAQNQQVNYAISGSVVDSATQKPVDYATISLNTTAGLPVKASYTKANGSFSLDKVAAGKYSLSVVNIGYGTKTVAIEVAGNLNIGKLILVTQSKELNEVKITATRPIIKQDVDRITYDIQADPESKMQNMLEMMRKVPLMSLDAGDNVQMKGNGNFKILINGKPSGMMTRSPRDALRSMRASNILKVEVITTPPSKYDGEGLAGIVNIITNKRVDEGYNGDVGLYYITYESHGTWTDLNVKKGKFGATVYAEGFIRNGPDLHFKNFRESVSPIKQRVEQRGSNSNNNDGKGMYITTDLSYEIDSLNLLAGSIGYYPDVIDRESNQFVKISNDNSLDQQYRLDNTEKYNRDALDLGLDYQLGFKNNKDRILTASYQYMGASTNQDSRSMATAPIFDAYSILRQRNKASSNEQTFQLDYVHPLKKLNIEGGFKTIFRDNSSDIISDNFFTNDDLDAAKTDADRFNYLQRVYAFYNSYQYTINDKNTIKAGLRLERTTIDADFITQDTSFSNSYNNMIPSIAFQHKFKNDASVNLGYTQRIQRPNIWQLNPFVNQSNPLFYTSGNPELLPVLNHNFELSYSKFSKGTYVVGLSYMFADNTIQNVVTLSADSISRSSYANIGKNDNLGVDVNVNYPFSSKLSMNISGRLAYLWLDGFVNNNAYNNKGLQGNLNTNWSYTLGKDWRLSADLSYTSRSLSLQGETNTFVRSAVRVSKSVFSKKAEFMVAVINPFPQYRNVVNRLTTPDFVQENAARVYYRGVHVNFFYRFGKLKGEIKKNKREITNDDVDKMK
ncbi:MAG: TonB-dependent receptor [Sphingobacteriales bacterium]|nr:MAG: TonB-dependent receptor [Sphingobacteriales bacterium]